MKRLILTFSMAIAAGLSFAQHTTANYGKSVFYDVKPVLQKSTSEAVATARQQFPGWSVYTDAYSGSPVDLYGKAMEVSGNTLTEKAAHVMAHKLPGINPAEWVLVKEHSSTRAKYVNYVRKVSGHSVLFSKMSFRFAKDGKLVRIQVKSYGNEMKNSIAVSSSEAEQSRVLTEDIEGIKIVSKQVMQDWVWFPVPSGNDYSLHPAWHVKVKASVEGSVPMQLNCYVDAITGKLLYRNNEVKEAFDVTVKGNVYKTSILSPATLEPLENLNVYPGFNTLVTNSLGIASSPSVNVPINTTFRLEGAWSSVIDVPSGQIPTFSQNVVSLGGTYNMPASSRHTSAYYHVNKIHGFMKSYMPSFPNLDVQLTTNVDDNTGTCNAFYDGASINFFSAGGGCESFAEVPDVVYHEYGHGISNEYYNFMGMGTIFNGALNEANSDIWGTSITQIPVNGNGAFTTVPGGGYIRRYDGEPKMYPRDIIEEVHGDGEIVAGCWVDVATNLGSMSAMTQLFTSVYDDTPDGPDGTEGDVYHQVLVSALLNDDIDNNIANGTPNFAPIVKAFAKHGIYLLGEVSTTHVDIAHQPTGAAIAVSADIFIMDNTFLQDVNLMYRNRVNGANWQSVPMTNTAGLTFAAQIPAQTAIGIIDYYFQLRTLQGVSNGVLPLQFDTTASRQRFVTIPYQFAVNVVAKDSSKFEGAPLTGWTIGNAAGDDATAGKWIQAAPVPSFTPNGTYFCQAPTAHGGNQCLVTGNASNSGSPLGDADVDGGKTTVVTASFDLSAYTEPMIEYYRWYANSKGGNAGNDAWSAKIGNASASTWFTVDSTYASDYSWRRRIFAVRDYLTSLTDVQMRFEATDMMVPTLRNDGQSVTEAAVDDFFIYDKKPVGISDPYTLKAEIYPNPADDRITITTSKAVSGTIRLCDVTGKVISQLEMDGSTSKYALNTKQAVAGTYMLVIQTSSSVQTQKIVLKH